MKIYITRYYLRLLVTAFTLLFMYIRSLFTLLIIYQAECCVGFSVTYFELIIVKYICK